MSSSLNLNARIRGISATLINALPNGRRCGDVLGVANRSNCLVNTLDAETFCPHLPGRIQWWKQQLFISLPNDRTALLGRIKISLLGT